MPRRLPDDPIEALQALDPIDVRRASSDLRINRVHFEEALSLASNIEHRFNTSLNVAADTAIARDADLARFLVRDMVSTLDYSFVVDADRSLPNARQSDLSLARELALDLSLDRVFTDRINRLLGQVFDRSLIRALDSAFDLDLVRGTGLDRAIEDFQGFPGWIQTRAVEAGVSQDALWEAMVTQRWWLVLATIWAISVTEPHVRNRAFNQDEADRARSQVEPVERSWQNIALDPQIALDPGDEEFIHEQLTKIRSQLILGGIPEVIDRALAALHKRFANRSDPEAIIRSVFADHDPPLAKYEIDWLVGQYQKANDLVSQVSTADDAAAGQAHAEIAQILGEPLPPPSFGSSDAEARSPGNGRTDSPSEPRRQKIGDALVVNLIGGVARDTVGALLGFIVGQTGLSWFQELWEIINALSKNWPFPT